MLAEKIVVVDDDYRIHQSLKEILFEYQLVSFLDAQKALDYLLRPNEIKLAIVDVRMQGLNGLELLESLRRVKEDLAIMIITAHGGLEVVVEVLRLHADDYVEKPFDINELRGRVKSILKEKSRNDNLARDPQAQVERIKLFVQNNYTNATLEYVAQEMCLSTQYVGRLFLRHEKEGFRMFRVRVRMEKAMELLEHSSLDISEIAYQLGYENPESFMRSFKKHVKENPAEFRARHQLKRKDKA